MEQNRASRRFTVIIFVLTAVMMLFAWIHSCFPASLSSMESEGVFLLIYRFFGLFGAEPALTETLIRKLAHFSEFAAIGALLTCCAYCFDRMKPQHFEFAVLFTGLISAVIDETIQLFSEGRAGLVTDVWIDFGGVVSGSLVMLGILSLHRRRKIAGGIWKMGE